MSYLSKLNINDIEAKIADVNIQFWNVDKLENKLEKVYMKLSLDKLEWPRLSRETFIQKVKVFMKSDYYIVPSPSTTLQNWLLDLVSKIPDWEQ